ncbi:MAG: hypothetical protein KatS3mg034_1027 [Vicingaceae bacterium]|nr:MAG: hypothetical protein KatS3mg034_1027 [Vicingaceae bacterium]
MKIDKVIDLIGCILFYLGGIFFGVIIAFLAGVSILSLINFLIF